MKTLNVALLLLLLVDGLGYAALPEFRHLANKQTAVLVEELNVHLDRFDATLVSPAPKAGEERLECYEETIRGEATVARLDTVTMVTDAPELVLYHD